MLGQHAAEHTVSWEKKKQNMVVLLRPYAERSPGGATGRKQLKKVIVFCFLHKFIPAKTKIRELPRV